VVNALLLLALGAASDLQDPTRPLMLTPLDPVVRREAAPSPVPRLEAVLHSGGRVSAILDGRPYLPGDTVGDYHLVRITPDHVVLEGRNGVLELALFPSLSMQSNQ
jgi:hypothetical protein